MILWLISPATSAPSPFLWPTRSTWPPWVYSTSQRTMEPQVFEGGGIGNMFKNWWRGKLWQTWWLEIRNCNRWHMDLNYIYYTNHYHPSLLIQFALSFPDPTVGLSPSMIWEAPGSMYALAKERSVSAWLIPVYVCFRSFSRTNVGNKYLHFKL